MSMQLGRNSKITIAGTEVEEVTSVSISNASDMVKVKPLKATHTKVVGHTILDVNGTISMIEDLDDAGQTLLRNQCLTDGTTLVSGVKVYTSDAHYWESDTVTDADSGCTFTNYSAEASDGDNPVTSTADYSFSGATQLTAV